MKEVQQLEPVSDMAQSFGSQARDLLKAHCAPAPVVATASAPKASPAKKGLLAKAMDGLADLLKAQVKGYTKKDGTVVKPYVSKVQKRAGSIESHPNYHPDDHAALKEKGYSDPEISAIWDADTARNGGQPTGGNPRNDLKLPTQEKPDGQPGPAADAREKAKAAYAPLRKQAGEKGQAALDAYAKAGESKDPAELKAAMDAVHAGKTAHEAAGKAARAIPYPGSSSPWEHHDERASSLGKLHAELSAKHKAASKAAKPKKAAPAAAPAPAAGGDGVLTPKVPGVTAPAAAPAAAAASGPVGDAPPHGDANEAGWDQLPDEENPKYAMQGMSSKDLGRLATMPSKHAHAYAHAELANRGLDSDGNWKGFDGAKAHHASAIPADFKPGGPDADGIAGHMQTVKGKVLQAAAKGHLDLQKRARAELAGRGHDTNGNWIGFDKAKQLHGVGGKKPAGGGSGSPNGPQQADLFKALRSGERPMFFVAADRAGTLEALVASAEWAQK